MSAVHMVRRYALALPEAEEHDAWTGRVASPPRPYRIVE